MSHLKNQVLWATIRYQRAVAPHLIFITDIALSKPTWMLTLLLRAGKYGLSERLDSHGAIARSERF